MRVYPVSPTRRTAGRARVFFAVTAFTFLGGGGFLTVVVVAAVVVAAVVVAGAVVVAAVVAGALTHDGFVIVFVSSVTAPSRASTLVNYVGLDESMLDCVLEIAGSYKIGKYMPGIYL